MQNHIENVINLSDVDLDKIRTRKFKVVVDGKFLGNLCSLLEKLFVM